MRFYWDWAGADPEIKRGIKLNPNNPVVDVTYTRHLTFTGRSEKALASLKRTRELDPVNYF